MIIIGGYRNLGKPELLADAEKNLAFLWTGWDDALGGGIYWSSEFLGKHAFDSCNKGDCGGSSTG